MDYRNKSTSKAAFIVRRGQIFEFDIAFSVEGHDRLSI